MKQVPFAVWTAVSGEPFVEFFNDSNCESHGRLPEDYLGGSVLVTGFFDAKIIAVPKHSQNMSGWKTSDYVFGWLDEQYVGMSFAALIALTVVR